METHTGNWKIYLVDDDSFSLSITEQCIKNIGFTNVTCFNNGTDCLNKLNEKPDIIFLDHNMDVLDGFEVLKKVKRVNPNIYVVMLSGQESIETAVDSLKFGAFDYIIKGEDEENKIANVLNRIAEVHAMLTSSKPSFLKMFLSIL